jgi:hypothetical protein
MLEVAGIMITLRINIGCHGLGSPPHRSYFIQHNVWRQPFIFIILYFNNTRSLMSIILLVIYKE